MSKRFNDKVHPADRVCVPGLAARTHYEENISSGQTYLEGFVAITALIKLRDRSIQLHLLLLEHKQIARQYPPKFSIRGRHVHRQLH